MDRLSKHKRSELMSKIRSVSVMEVRARGQALRIAKCALRHQPKGIYGRPDYANKARKVAVYVHGCFFHGCSVHFKAPKTNRRFWVSKIERNQKRHRHVAYALRRDGWRVYTLWEHDIIR